MGLLNDIQFELGGRQVLEGRQAKDGATGEYQPDFGQWVFGVTGEQLQNAGEVKEERGIEKDFKAAQESVGVEYTPGLSRGQQQRRLSQGTKKQNWADFDESPQGKAAAHQMGIQTKTMEQQGQRFAQQHEQSMAALQSSERQADARLAATLEEGRNSRQQAMDFRMMDKGDDTSDRAMALELEQMRGNREDKRLKMQHDRYYADKKSSSMQALVAGLAALGAAFAL